MQSMNKNSMTARQPIRNHILSRSGMQMGNQYGMPNNNRPQQTMNVQGRNPMNPYGHQFNAMQIQNMQQRPQMMNYPANAIYNRGMGMPSMMNNPNMMGQNAMQMRQNPVRPMGNWQQNMTNMRMNPNNPIMMQQQQRQMQQSQMHQQGQMGMNYPNSMVNNQMGMQGNYQNQGNMMMNQQNAQMNPQNQQQMYQQNPGMNNYG